MHLIIDFHSSNILLMRDCHEMVNFLNEVAVIAKMHVLGEPIVIGFPWPGSQDSSALSGVCFLKESAITVHTYPEMRFVFMDVFSCKDFNVHKVSAHICRAFGAESPTILVLDRGVDMEENTIIPVKLRR